MLKQRAVDGLRHLWNERAAEKFIEAGQLQDAEAKARAWAIGETLTLCAQELKKAEDAA